MNRKLVVIFSFFALLFIALANSKSHAGFEKYTIYLPFVVKNSFIIPTETKTPSPSLTITLTLTPTFTPTPLDVLTPTKTSTNNPTASATSTPTVTSTSTPSPTSTETPTSTIAPTSTPTSTPGNSPWQEVGEDSASGGGISNNDGNSWSQSLAISQDGTLYVVWQDSSGGDKEIYIRVWDGTAWEEVGTGSASGGGISDNDGDSYSPSLAISPDGTPYVAWNDNSSGNHEIYVLAWNGTTWEEVGAGSASGGGISNNVGGSSYPSVGVALDGAVYVAWEDDGIGREIFVRTWNGSSWDEVGVGSASGGGISNSSEGAYYPSLAIAPNGTPYVAWYDYSDGDTEIYIRVWNGNTWEEVGPGSASGGGISNNAGGSYVPSLAIAPSGNPYVAWSDVSGGDAEIYIRAWNGSSWDEVGVGSASGGGISDNTGGSYVPSLVVVSDTALYIAWNDNTSGNHEIYVLAWNGSDWVEVGAGSASFGGISSNIGDSHYPSLAIAWNGIPYVAWHDYSGGEPEIYVRQYIE